MYFKENVWLKKVKVHSKIVIVYYSCVIKLDCIEEQ